MYYLKFEFNKLTGTAVQNVIQHKSYLSISKPHSKKKKIKAKVALSDIRNTMKDSL